MSTETQTQAPDFAPKAAEIRPNILVTGVVSGVGDPVTTGKGDGYYDKAEVTFTNTRRSKKFKGSIMFRPEMFSLGVFNPDEHYGKYDENKVFVPSRFASQIITNSSGKQVPIGKSFSAVYNMNIMPDFSRDKQTKIVNGIANQTPLSYIVGGNLAGWNTLRSALVEALGQIPSEREVSEFGFATLTSTEIIEILRVVAKSNPQEQVFELRQQTDFQTGQPSQFYEISRAYGPLTQELHKRLVTRVEESKNTATRVVLGYSVS